MKKKPIVLVDVDETIVENIDDWKNWYNQICSEELDFKELDRINESLISDEHINPLDYWRNPNLYDDKKPIKEAVKVIKKFDDKFNFVFVSNCFSEHKDSKIRFIKKYFGKYPFVDTAYKEYVMCNIAIDDRAFYLRNIKEKQPNCEIIQIKTAYNNYNEFLYFDWNEIEKFLESY